MRGSGDFEGCGDARRTADWRRLSTLVYDAAMSPIPPELVDDLPRFFAEWLCPAIRKALKRSPHLTTLSAQIELQLRSGDPTPDIWHLDLNDAELRATAGPCDKPDVIIKVHTDDALALLEGDLDPQAALVDGHLRVSGDMALATQIAPLLRSKP